MTQNRYKVTKFQLTYVVNSICWNMLIDVTRAVADSHVTQWILSAI